MNELALKDIHLPEVILWWPLAPGWWLILILTVLLVIFFPRILRWLRWKPTRVVSLRELNQIRADRDNGLDEQRVLQGVTILLRRTVMSYCGRAMGANLTGKRWVEQLKQLSGKDCFTAEQNEWLSIGQYQPSAQCDIELMLRSCECWIKALPRRSANVAD